MATGIVFDIKRYCVHDGPNIRTTVFLKGCPLRCWWCHNPEGRDLRPQLVYKEKRCIRCGQCHDACEKSGITKNGKPVVLHSDRCDVCGTCTSACPTGALEVVGKEYTHTQLVDVVEQDRVFFEESGGGVTFSGGEPLSQPKFLLATLRECRRRRIHTVVDTCGFASQSTIESIQPYVNLFLYDVKLMDDRRHIRYTGVSNEIILANLAYLARTGSMIQLVLPLIPHVNDDNRNIDALAGLALRAGIRSISILPYHRLGSTKLALFHELDKMNETEEPDGKRVQGIADRLNGHGLQVQIGNR